ncbi:hypothetical protein EMIT0194P_360011 [Pseudomonas serbica]
MEENLTDLRHGTAIVKCPPYMPGELLRRFERSQCCKCYEASGLKRQTRASPHATPCMLVNEVLEGLPEGGRIVHGLIDKLISHYGFSDIDPA